MLQIHNIRKQYVTGELVQVALDEVSLTLRDNEFVAILGPSGSGKTTLLNVIGGLDRYDSGDLIINGISTQKYSDRDWDSYRNHTIGFVFQSYNLIPHQTILSNVELALTISGISRSERRKRAKKALEDVGLGNQLHKKPNQMSGGQMQRVAIARALVNNPDILLADEPTGALDSDTSLQVMELLKEVSKDRLVVMVTHNPELAESYASRIVRLKDGKITDDTNPYTVEPEGLEPPRHKNMGKASMSLFTALSLSFNNLRTKKGRTLLTAFAGSIGIIGICLIMSLSTGFQKYIDKIQEDTLSNYPLTIQSESTDLSAALSAYGSTMSMAESAEAGTVIEQQMMSQMFANIGSNDLASFKSYLEENITQIDSAINSIQYSYGVKPLIYASDTANGITQVNPGTLFGSVTGSSTLSNYMDTNIFYEMIDNTELLDSQYDVLRGHWPEKEDELVIVLSDANRITDYMTYTLGLKDSDQLLKMIQQVMNGQEVGTVDEPMQWTYDDLLSLDFTLVPASACYQYNAQYSVWEDMSDDEAYMAEQIENGCKLKIVGIVCPKEGISTTMLSSGVAYTSALTRKVIEDAEKSQIVANQLSDRSVDVFTGNRFDELVTEASSLNFEDMISIDEEVLTSAFGMDMDENTVVSLFENYMNKIAGSITVDTEPAQKDFLDTLSVFARDMLNDYIQENADPETGEAVLRLAEAEELIDRYLAEPDAQKQMKSLESKYRMADGAFAQVYKPLLLGMVTGYIALEMELPEIPEVTIPDATLPDITLPDATFPDVTLPNIPDTDDPAQETGKETEPTVETGKESEENTDPSEDPTQGSEETVDPTEDRVGAAEEATGQSQEAADDAQTISTDLDLTDSSLVQMSFEDLNIDFDADQLCAVITAEQVDSTVDAFLDNTLVVATAGVMSRSMMEATLQSILLDKLAGFGDVLMNYMGSTFYVDKDAFASAFRFNMSEDELRRLMEAMSGAEKERSVETNLSNLGYAELSDPASISIYFVDFASKETFLEFLDGYNLKMEASGNEDQIISYTDVTNIMMSSVRTIIDSVSYVLIAFVAVSLIVSSIMIGIITYISVMERTKEIGVLRAMGASKKNISQVFNAETFIIGLCSGLLGVGISELLNFPINALLLSLTGNPDIRAQLPLQNAAALVLLSVLLTLIGGFIPAKHAARKDPVIALRSE